MSIQHAPLSDLDPATVYRLLALRSAVFVVEQNCPYLDPDGRDLERDAEQWWIAEGDAIVACLRVLTEPGAALVAGVGVRRIGRVATAAHARGRGLAGRLIDAVLTAQPRHEFVLSGQLHLAHWYAGFGFVAEGEPYPEDGIPHVQMRRAARATGQQITAG